MSGAYTVSNITASPNRKERVELADMLRGKDLIAGLTTPDVRRAIARVRRRKGTAETTRSPRHYTLGSVVAKIAERLIFWEGKGQDPRGVHKSFAELEAETGETKRKLQTARAVGEEEGLWTAEAGFRPGAACQRTLWWRVNLWRLHEVVYTGASEETRANLENGGRPEKMEELRAREWALKVALDDLSLRFMENPETVTEKDAEQPQDTATIMTTCTQADNSLYRLQDETHHGFEERVSLRETPKKGSLGAPKITPKEAYDLWHALVGHDPHGKSLEAMADELARRNKTGEVAWTKVWNKIGRKYSLYRESEDLSEEAWEHGMEAVAVAGSCSVSYAVKAACRWQNVFDPDGGRFWGVEDFEASLDADYATPEGHIPGNEQASEVPEPEEPAPGAEDPVPAEEAAQYAAPPLASASEPEPVAEAEPKPRYTYNRDRLEGMKSASAATVSGQIPAEDGGWREQELHVQLIAMMRDPGTRFGGMVAERRDGDAGMTFEEMAKEAEGLLGSGRPPDWLAGAIEYHVQTLQQKLA